MKKEPLRSKIRWADSIQCYVEDNKFWIIGDLWEEGATDLMNAYEAGDDSPHVRFANSSSDEELIGFTATYGPFIVSAADWQSPLWIASAHQPRRSQARGTKHVVESRYACVPWDDLRREQTFYAALLDVTHGVLREDRIAAEQHLLDGKPPKKKGRVNRNGAEALRTERLQLLIDKAMQIRPRTREWEEAFKREHQAHVEAMYDLGANWTWNSDRQMRLEAAFVALQGLQPHLLTETKVEWLELATYELKNIIVTILDSFPSQIRWDLQHTEEVPAQDLLFGIRPVLMAMLRRDVMFKREVRICIREGCGRYFVATRIDKRCCSAKCTEMLNNRRQYLRLTKPRRQSEAAKRNRRKRKG